MIAKNYFSGSYILTTAKICFSIDYDRFLLNMKKFGKLADTLMFSNILEDTILNKAKVQLLVKMIHSVF